ncbi:glycoside hydrolase family 95 protein [Enterococcus sp. LJL98]
MRKKLYFDRPCRLTKRRHEGDDGTWSRFGLPIGNGSLGAMLGGEVFQEVIQLNEESLINGGPLPNQVYHHGNQSSGHEALKEIQALLLAGENAQATSRCQEALVGLKEGYGSYQNLGELVIGYQFGETDVSHYQRALDLETGVHQVQFQIGNNQVKRTSFMSFPDQLFVHHFQSQEALDLFLCFQTEHPHQIKETPHGFCVKGYLSDNHLQFGLMLAFEYSEGTLLFEDGGIRLSNCSEATMIISAVTDYAPIFPTYRQSFPQGLLEERITNGLERGFLHLKERHLKDYQELFNRVTLDLGGKSEGPVNQIMAAGGLPLVELLYHFGRYLLISSSRPGGLPSNLQGVWNETNTPPWGSDYHLNVNLQMNYWGAAGGNLLETIEPLVAYVEHLRAPGRLTAAAYHQIISDEEKPMNGFTAHTQTTPFGFTGPGWDFEWGWSPAVVPWILENLYDVYLFTLDQTYLARIYPILKEATCFFEQALVFNPKDERYYSAPAYSPEHGPITLGNVYEHVLIQQLLLNTIASARQLELDEPQVARWQALSEQIRTEEIGEAGQLKEWFEETDFGSVDKFQASHRHVSHLLGLYPLHRIKKDTPLATAAKISLVERGLGTTGWSMIHRGLLWARIGNGEQVAAILQGFFEQCLHENLLATHPPFQIDANLGYLALVQEILLQSHVESLIFLPALPKTWSEGKVTGFRARGGLVVDFSWQQNQLQEAIVYGKSGQMLQVTYANLATDYQLLGVTLIEERGDTCLVRFEKAEMKLERKK